VQNNFFFGTLNACDSNILFLNDNSSPVSIKPLTSTITVNIGKKQLIFDNIVSLFMLQTVTLRKMYWDKIV